MKPGTPDPESLETAPVPTSEPTQDGTLSATASAPASEPTKPGTPDPESLASVPPVERGTREGAPSPPTETTDVFLPPRIEHGEVPVAVPQRVEGAQQAETPREVWSPITSFSWDQGSFETPWVNVVVNMAGVSEEKVWCKFDVDMFDLKIKTSAGNFRLFRNALDQDIIPAKSRVVVKTGRVTVKLRKAPSDVEPEPGKPTSYEAWNTLGKKGGRRERELEKAPRVEDSEYYEIARLMYEEGNDAIRRQIGEAYERNKRREMEEGPEPLKAILEATSSSVPPYPSYFPQSAARASSSR
ncbi:hypothetical protein CTAYLR_004809 [Chrysophaeum taylorii]|uniref:CS domain-containing protein n=1 Tax=Chrysophaeum taylorii TaxID=2483200 RepID=A0AAD7XU10_9STRA|nr:hypothetical protein CTAYLR_004809 [Chrysophaeum taylorii]